MAEKKTTTKKTAPAKKSKTETAEKKTTTKKTAPAKVKETKPVEAVKEVKMETIVPVVLPEFVGDKRDDDDAFIFDESKYDENSTRYFEATGRRKTAIARVRLYTRGDKTITINNKDIADYFKTLTLQRIVISSLDKMKSTGRFKITVIVKGGGMNSQAEAVRHGIARALVIFNPEYRKRLRKAGFLTRDSRMKERKKFGLKRARRAPQWSKR